MSDEPTVFVVDDDPAMRKSLRWLIESVGLNVQTHASAREFLDSCNSSQSGCLVLDVRMPEMSGLDLQDRLRENDIDLPVIFITGYGDVPMAVRAMKAGAIDFIEKPVSDQIFIDLIQRAISENIKGLESRAEHHLINERIDRLTQREHEVMKLVVAGLSSKKIADQLGVSFKTIEAHRAKIMKKMEAQSIPHLIRMSLMRPQEAAG